MRKYILILTAFASVITACSSESAKETNADSSEVIAKDTTFSATEAKNQNCYVYTKNKDTANLKLNINGEELTGDLSYNLFEKDKNSGTIAGEIKGDTIIAEYTFDSEGMRSTREVVFLKKDGKLYEGFGDIEEKGGKTLFKDRSKLKFADAIVFSETNCK